MSTNSPSESAAAPATGAPAEADTRAPDPQGKIRGALLRYRVLAWFTGLWLLLLVGEMVWKYVLGLELPEWGRIIPIVHGWVYMIYLLLTLDLAIKVRWPWAKTILTLLAGTIPFLSFWFEHQRTQDVKRAFQV